MYVMYSICGGSSYRQLHFNINLLYNSYIKYTILQKITVNYRPHYLTHQIDDNNYATNGTGSMLYNVIILCTKH